jgi:hypothetical protein
MNNESAIAVKADVIAVFPMRRWSMISRRRRKTCGQWRPEAKCLLAWLPRHDILPLGMLPSNSTSQFTFLKSPGNSLDDKRLAQPSPTKELADGGNEQL